MNYEQDIRIDEDALDVEWLDQPALFLKYSRHSALLEKEKDESKERLEFVKAELDRKIRLNPEKFGVEKITDKVVENTIILQLEYKQASEQFIQAKFEWTTARGAVDAFNQRKEALENLARLHGQNYFAGPKIPRDLHQEHTAWQNRIDANIARHINRTK